MCCCFHQIMSGPCYVLLLNVFAFTFFALSLYIVLPCVVVLSDYKVVSSNAVAVIDVCLAFVTLTLHCHVLLFMRLIVKILRLPLRSSLYVYFVFAMQTAKGHQWYRHFISFSIQHLRKNNKDLWNPLII